MKKLIGEFKEFISRGSVMELAVGVIIGAAFKSIVDSLVNDIITPLLGLVAKDDFSELSISIGSVAIRYGAFISAVLNFLLMAVVLFLLMKAVNSAKGFGGRRRGKREEAPQEPPRLCPYCRMEIAADASRCPHCTSVLDAGEAEDANRDSR